MNTAAFKVVRMRNPLWLILLLPFVLLALAFFALFFVFATLFPGRRVRLRTEKPQQAGIIEAEYRELTSVPEARSVSADL